MATPPRTADKRRVILEAAVRVFAERGYHACRVGDIGKEAGVAYGLLYHYFPSKEAVLETIFHQVWSEMLEAVSGIEAAGGPAREQLRRVAAIVLGSWKRDPDLIRVLVREVTRSPQLQHEIEEIEHAFAALERIIRRGQEAGELRPDLDARLAAWVLYGALEQVLTGWVMEAPPRDDEEVGRAVATVTAVICDGLAR